MASYIIKTKEQEIKKNFDYLPDVTDKLDKIQHPKFDINIIREITLWKLGRYVDISDEVVGKLNSLETMKEFDAEQTRFILKDLLDCEGVGLPNGIHVSPL